MLTGGSIEDEELDSYGNVKKNAGVRPCIQRQSGKWHWLLIGKLPPFEIIARPIYTHTLVTRGLLRHLYHRNGGSCSNIYT